MNELRLLESRLADMQSFVPELHYVRGLWQLSLKAPVHQRWTTSWQGTLEEVITKAEAFTEHAREYITK